VTLAAARSLQDRAGSPLREVLRELMSAAGLVRRIGTNLNQAVTRLNATGQPGEDLVPSAEFCVRVIHHLDEAAEQVRATDPKTRMLRTPKRSPNRLNCILVGAYLVHRDGTTRSLNPRANRVIGTCHTSPRPGVNGKRKLTSWRPRGDQYSPAADTGLASRPPVRSICQGCSGVEKAILATTTP
jgi:hypothetical protein